MEEIFSRVHSAARDAERPLPVCCRPPGLSGGRAAKADVQRLDHRVLKTRHHDRIPCLPTENAFREPQPVDLQSGHDHHYDASRKRPDVKRVVQTQTSDAIFSHGKSAVNTISYYFFDFVK